MTKVIDPEIHKLKSRIQNLESELSSIKTALNNLIGTKTDSPSFAKTSPKLESNASSSTSPKQKKSWEQWEYVLGGNWIAKIGVLAILLATGWFLNLAFTEDWITDSGKIFVGLLFGFGFLLGSNYFAIKGFRILTPALLGAGVSILYLTIFSAFRFYNYFSVQEAFFYLTGLSVFAVLMAKVAESEIIYSFGFIGSILSPVLLSSGENSYRFLFLYLFLNLILFIWVSRGKAWKWALYLVFISSWTIFSVWVSDNLSTNIYWIPIGFVLSSMVVLLYRELFLEFRTNLTENSLSTKILVVGNLLVGSANIGYITNQNYPSFYGHSLVFCSLLTIYIVHNFQKRESLSWPVPTLFYISIGLALYAITEWSDGAWLSFSQLTFAFLFSYLTLDLTKTKNENFHLRLGSGFLWMIALLNLIFQEGLGNYSSTLLFNSRFGIFLFAVIGLSIITYLSKKKEFSNRFVFIYSMLTVSILILSFLFEVRYFVEDYSRRNQGYSFVLAAFAVIFLLLGFRYSSNTLRRLGIGLIGIIIVKFGLYDIWQLSLAGKIGSGFVLGILFVIIGLFYEKFKTKILGEEK